MLFHCWSRRTKTGEVYFRLIGTNPFHEKAKNERCTVTGSRRCQIGPWIKKFTSLFGRLRQEIAPKGLPHVRHDYFFVLIRFNQSNQWFIALLLTLHSSFSYNREFKNWQRQRQTTTPKINYLIGWMKKNNRAARAARFLVQCLDVVCQTTTWNFHIWGSDDNGSDRSSKSFIFFLYVKTTRSKRKCTPPILFNVTNIE